MGPRKLNTPFLQLTAQRTAVACAMAVCLFAQAAVWAQPAPAGPADRAVTAAQKYLLEAIGDDGRVKGEFEADNPRHGGKTALACYALLSSGAKADPESPLPRSLAWLAKAEMTGTYAVSMRICALAASGDARYRKRIGDDAAWLKAAADADGRYTYIAADKASTGYDNSNTQFAALAMAAAADMGIETPLQWWSRLQTHFQQDQQVDGGWGYRIPPGHFRTQSYGSMTAAALASLYHCTAMLQADSFLRCTAQGESPAINRGLAWIEQNYSITMNPRKAVEYYYYWLWSLQRVAGASGRKRFGKADWLAEGTARLLRLQDADGSFGYGDRIDDTSMALLFLSRGRLRVGISKLQWAGRWNSRPADAAHAAAWLRETFELPIRWQVIAADGPEEDFADAPVLYLSGAGPIELTDEQLAKLRRFVLGGGLILSEAACNNADFTADLQRLYRRMLPEWTFGRIGDDDPLYGVQYAVKDLRGLWGVHNGVRWLAVHSPVELSMALHRNDRRSAREVFEIFANIYLYATGFERLPRLAAPAPPAAARKTIRVARLRYDGAWNPEPAALGAVAAELAARGIRLDVAESVDFIDLALKAPPVLFMTGTKGFSLDEQQAAALRDWLRGGGTLIVDAAGGSKAFAESVDRQILPLVGGPQARVLPADHALYRGVLPPGEKDLYRQELAEALEPTLRTQPRLLAAEGADRRVSVFYSRDDLTAALAGARTAGIRGYTPRAARRIVAGIVAGLTDVSRSGK